MVDFLARIKKYKHLFGNKEQHDLKQDYENFVQLLAENDFALELINELDGYYRGKNMFTIPYLRNTTKKLVLSVQNAVRLLNLLTDDKYQHLSEVCESLATEIRGVVTGEKEPIFTPTAVYIDHVFREMADKVGDKMANLGEIRNRLELPVPDGFATTVCAYAQFMEYSHLDFAISRLLQELDLEDTEKVMKVEQDIKELIRNAELPYDLSSSLHKGCEYLAAAGEPVYLSFRSSALGEDAESSFAGQYSTLLNVAMDQVEESYKEIVASKYNARAIYYRYKRGYRDEDVAMSVGIVKMVDAVASGVIYTEDPNDPDRHQVTVCGLWGLGQLLVDGEITPDTFVLDKDQNFRIVSSNVSSKRVMLAGNPQGGIKKVRVPENKRDVPCLDPEQLRTLLGYAAKIEEHYGWPQDIEWALDRDGTFYILQSRPLSLEEKSAPCAIDLSGYELLLEGGETACSGVGAGPVFRYRSDHDLVRCPKGAVLVAPRTSPRFVKVMDRVSAIVTNVGSLTDHMSSLAREFHVPTLVNMRKATKRLSEGEWVIVDAGEKRVLRCNEGESLGWCMLERKPPVNIKVTESHHVLSRLIPLIVPLHLYDPNSPDFREQKCTTLHDILRFAHEKGMAAMYERARQTTTRRSKQRAYRLESKLPLLIYIIDLDGKVIHLAKKKKIPPEQVDSKLFQAFWGGLTDRRLRWDGFMTGDLDLKGFFSAMSQTMVDTLESEQAMGSNYFIVAENYLNAAFRFGYHFTTVDAYVCPTVRDNYVVFTFRGGAAPEERRLRRIELISRILKHYEFELKTKGDFLTARTKYESADECINRLEMLGRLVGATRLVDMALTSDALVEKCVSHFLEGDYSLGLFDDQP